MELLENNLSIITAYNENNEYNENHYFDHDRSSLLKLNFDTVILNDEE